MPPDPDLPPPLWRWSGPPLVDPSWMGHWWSVLLVLVGLAVVLPLVVRFVLEPVFNLLFALVTALLLLIVDPGFRREEWRRLRRLPRGHGSSGHDVRASRGASSAPRMARKL